MVHLVLMTLSNLVFGMNFFVNPSLIEENVNVPLPPLVLGESRLDSNQLSPGECLTSLSLCKAAGPDSLTSLSLCKTARPDSLTSLSLCKTAGPDSLTSLSLCKTASSDSITYKIPQEASNEQATPLCIHYYRPILEYGDVI